MNFFEDDDSDDAFDGAGDECDHRSVDSPLLKDSSDMMKDRFRKQFCDVFDLAADGHHWSPPTPTSDCSLSSACYSPISRMSSPSPTSVCGTPTLYSPYSPSSTLASIRDAVSHLTRLDDFNVVKLSEGFFSQVFKVWLSTEYD